MTSPLSASLNACTLYSRSHVACTAVHFITHVCLCISRCLNVNPGAAMIITPPAHYRNIYHQQFTITASIIPMSKLTIAARKTHYRRCGPNKVQGWNLKIIESIKLCGNPSQQSHPFSLPSHLTAKVFNRGSSTVKAFGKTFAVQSSPGVKRGLMPCADSEVPSDPNTVCVSTLMASSSRG